MPAARRTQEAFSDSAALNPCDKQVAHGVEFYKTQFAWQKDPAREYPQEDR